MPAFVRARVPIVLASRPSVPRGPPREGRRAPRLGFEPFFRADRSRARGTGGLGLALARRIVQAHEGSIAFTSAIDKGTVARVWLPAR